MNDSEKQKKTSEEIDQESLSHESNGLYCSVYHLDGEGQCAQCKYCKEWIRPSQMNNICRARRAGTEAKNE